MKLLAKQKTGKARLKERSMYVFFLPFRLFPAFPSFSCLSQAHLNLTLQWASDDSY